MEAILPWAWFERTTRTCSWCGKEMSPAKRARPLTSGGSSSRATDFPIHLLLPPVIGACRCGRGGVDGWPRRSPSARHVGTARASSVRPAETVGVAAGRHDQRKTVPYLGNYVFFGLMHS